MNKFSKKLIAILALVLSLGCVMPISQLEKEFIEKDIPVSEASPESTDSDFATPSEIFQETSTPHSLLEAPDFCNALLDFDLSSMSIAIQVLMNDHHDIYTLKANGVELKRLTKSNMQAGYPLWSPDGEKLAYISVQPGTSDWEIFGTGHINYINMSSGKAYKLTFPEMDMSGSYIWNPDGNSIVFQAIQNGEAGLFRYDFSTDTVKEMILSEPVGIVDFRNPKWSSDGRYIAYESVVGVTETRIFILDVENFSIGKTDPTFELSEAFEISERSPHWHPSNGMIYFISDNMIENTSQIFSMNLDGTNRQQIIGGEAYISWFTLSSDGQVLFFIQDRIKDAQGNCCISDTPLFSVMLDGSDQRMLDQDFGEHPILGPDGRHIAYSRSEVGQDGLYIFDACTGEHLYVFNGNVLSFPVWQSVLTQSQP